MAGLVGTGGGLLLALGGPAWGAAAAVVAISGAAVQLAQRAPDAAHQS
jgi:hypothetical protein